MMRRDRNEPEIVKALQAAGASVVRIESAGSSQRGVVDLLAGHRGVTYMLEIKTPPTGPKGGGGGRLSPEQEDFIATWKGGPVVVVRTVLEALAAIGLTHGEE